jgi:hypothetical protein
MFAVCCLCCCRCGAVVLQLTSTASLQVLGRVGTQPAKATARITITDCNIPPGITIDAPKLQAFSVYSWTHTVTPTLSSSQVPWSGVGVIPATAKFTRTPASTRFTASFTLRVTNPTKGPIALSNLQLSCPWSAGANILLPCGTPPPDAPPNLVGVIPVVPGANGVPVIPGANAVPLVPRGRRHTLQAGGFIPVAQQPVLPTRDGTVGPARGEIVVTNPVTGRQEVQRAAVFQPVQQNLLMVVGALQTGECAVSNLDIPAPIGTDFTRPCTVVSSEAQGTARVPPSTTVNFVAPQQSEPVSNKCAKWSITCAPAVGNPGYVPSVGELPAREVCGDDSNAPVAPSDFTLNFISGWVGDGTKLTDCTTTATVSRGACDVPYFTCAVSPFSCFAFSFIFLYKVPSSHGAHAHARQVGICMHMHAWRWGVRWLTGSLYSLRMQSQSQDHV